MEKIVKTEAEKLEDWLKKNNFGIPEAKDILKTIRNTKSRDYGTFEHDFSGRRHRIGVLGDTHFGNKWTDKAYLSSVMKHFKKQGVEAVYHVGDLTDGPWQRHKNVGEQYVHGFDDQVEDFVTDFPSIGKPVFVIDGNHDGWYRKGEGGVVGKAIANRRDDITYLGADEAVINFGKINMMLSHPDDGSSYAISYKPQKQLESMVRMGESMPNILLIGHYHKMLQMGTMGIHTFLTGTTCRQTPWMRGKKISADLGAWMLDVYKGMDGGLSRVVTELLPYHGDKHSKVIK